MRTMVFGILAMFFSLSAMASEAYDCSAKLPQGKAQLNIRTELDGSRKIKLVFLNEARSQIYVGVLQVVDQKADRLFAEGDLLSYEADPEIGVVLTGSLAPDRNGTVTLQLYAGGDRRIENGFGNILHCVKQ